MFLPKKQVKNMHGSYLGGIGLLKLVISRGLLGHFSLVGEMLIKIVLLSKGFFVSNLGKQETLIQKPVEMKFLQGNLSLQL